jgi:hypothetical protein
MKHGRLQMSSKNRPFTSKVIILVLSFAPRTRSFCLLHMTKRLLTLWRLEHKVIPGFYKYILNILAAVTAITTPMI